jgi:hypothetical protein
MDMMDAAAFTGSVLWGIILPVMDIILTEFFLFVDSVLVHIIFILQW